MITGIVLVAAAALPAIALLFGLRRFQRNGRSFRKDRPAAFLATLLAPVVLAAPLIFLATDLIVSNYSPPRNAYRAIFNADPEACISLVSGETAVSSEAKSARVAFTSSCGDLWTRFIRFKPFRVPVTRADLVLDQLGSIGLIAIDCPDLAQSEGTSGKRGTVIVLSCPTVGFYVVDARWVN